MKASLWILIDSGELRWDVVIVIQQRSGAGGQIRSGNGSEGTDNCGGNETVLRAWKAKENWKEGEARIRDTYETMMMV